METQFVYQKKRSEFGKQCMFADKGPELIDNFLPDRTMLKQYILKDPVHRHVQGAPVMAEHYLNTTRAEYTTSFMNHVEGGWPRDVNIADEEQTKRFRRKIEKDENYAHVMMQLCKNMESCVLQNNAINIYQQYFYGVEPTPQVEKCTARTVNVFQDQIKPTRPVTNISWSPDGQTKIANSHCNLVFQSPIDSESTHAFIWEIDNPNKPYHIFKPESPIICLEYHPKDPHCLISGHLNGKVSVWDTRKGYEPVETSVMETSFRDPVFKVNWINTKSGTEFFSGSSDGRVMWWDCRKLSEPTETLILHFAKDEEQSLSQAMGVSTLEYEPTIPTRFMVGTEQGAVIAGNRKGKTAMEKMVGKYSAHLGPVLAVCRNPGFIKNFLTIGDWCARIWSEDAKESAIMWTSSHKALLTDGGWSPTKLSAFMTTRSDGVLDIWDILQQQKHAMMGVKVCDSPLKCLRVHDSGKLVAVGNEKGTVYLVEFSDNLVTSNKNDKHLLTAMFERETRREKILEARNRELRLKRKSQTGLPEKGGDAQTQEGLEGVSPPTGEETPGIVDATARVDELKAGSPEEVVDDFWKDVVTQAEKEFFGVIKKETTIYDTELAAEEQTAEELEPLQEVSEPPPPPPESLPSTPGKKKKKKKRKKSKGRKKKKVKK